jgi:hypothetical protein
VQRLGLCRWSSYGTLVWEEKRRRRVHVEAGHTKPSEEGVSKAGLKEFQTGKDIWGPPTFVSVSMKPDVSVYYSSL